MSLMFSSMHFISWLHHWRWIRLRRSSHGAPFPLIPLQLASCRRLSVYGSAGNIRLLRTECLVVRATGSTSSWSILGRVWLQVWWYQWRAYSNSGCGWKDLTTWQQLGMVAGRFQLTTKRIPTFPITNSKCLLQPKEETRSPRIARTRRNARHSTWKSLQYSVSR